MWNIKIPRLKSTKGKTGSIRHPLTRKQWSFVVLDEVRKRQRGYKKKILILQRIQFESDQRIELRLGYYIIGKLPAMKGQWVWGQYAALLPAADFRALYRKAKKKGWFKS